LNASVARSPSRTTCHNGEMPRCALIAHMALFDLTCFEC
jgi:hypothetical protein